jgi:hypothetical protein
MIRKDARMFHTSLIRIDRFGIAQVLSLVGYYMVSDFELRFCVDWGC